MKICPFCQRQLLSQASPTCNWCGREIPDANYQQNAAVARERFYAQQAMQDIVSLAQIESISVGSPFGNPWGSPLNNFMGLPIGPAFPPLMPSMRTMPYSPPATPMPTLPPSSVEPPAPDTTAEETPESRFRHLEL